MNKNEKSRFWFAREAESYWEKQSTKKKIFILNITKNNTQIKQISSLKYVGYILYGQMLMETMTLNVLIQTNFERCSFLKTNS